MLVTNIISVAAALLIIVRETQLDAKEEAARRKCVWRCAAFVRCDSPCARPPRLTPSLRLPFPRPTFALVLLQAPRQR